ncbi:CDP-alcohol phosphatidyltransferase family protein [Nocardioides bizhenqiangii]|uniref:CDP-alcohol phosphatidyltransferase family protein n=1 Tax=Nocardioides bizhenqiangii TaxID=3095076 RepID=A0ABZ0ZV17_9ACTN|nr:MULTISPECIES: CDP-alcohol phosphatidyltransferase family protein [unclassified Nocardioides]MDZ5623189.1 CDP-alcohol phosphatidyltransferase family protein [Nocardioides sp. HM23]WQQ28162.1 CDP-alcohol phosphatidyltransferase family protein [Nocardioides sp. HM61]
MAGAPDRIYADASTERLLTGATVITFIRTIATLALSMWGAYEESLALLVTGLVVYWVGDTLDGEWARRFDCETRIGGVVDMVSDRLSCGAFYVGLAWLQPAPFFFSDEPMELIAIPVAVYLFEFMVIDMYLSLAFLAWPIRSPNYFYVVDRRIYLWNWSRVGKAANSGLFAVLLLATGWWWLGLIIAIALLVLKLVSLRWLLELGLPVPERLPAA